jgi:hypothetical protein
MTVTDYFLLKPGKDRMSGDEAEKVPTGRILTSIAGLVIGIVASFFITMAGATTDIQKGGPANLPAVTQTNPAPQAGGSMPNASAGVDQQLKSFTWSRFWTVFLISLAICGLTYQGLYFSLRLYANQPPFLILFVAFQYGYFWQSALKGASVVVAK